MNGFRSVPKKEKEYPKVIMPEEKDKIVNELLNKEGNGFYFEYKNVPNLNISMVQFEKVMIELESLKKTVEPPISEKVKTIAEIAASVTSALAFAFGRVQP